ncbi:MAG TPA: ion channel [Symbiobacteriaceae bacterium]|nr:ion channel [Symbiobacteriaceae bacterium]
MDQAPRWLLIRLLPVLALAALLLVLAGAPPSSRWPFVLAGAGCLTALWDGYAGVFRLLRRPRRAGRRSVPLQICALWLINTLAYLVLLNTAAELAVPGTFEWRGGPAAPLDVAYLTLLTFASSGYGDVLPANGLGKALAMVSSLAGLLYATMLVTAIWHHYAPDLHD